MIRNSIDHGIESPETRLQKGKPESGKVVLKAYHSGNHVFIEVEDDGAGLNRKKFSKKRLSAGSLRRKKLKPWKTMKFTN